VVPRPPCFGSFRGLITSVVCNSSDGKGFDVTMNIVRGKLKVGQNIGIPSHTPTRLAEKSICLVKKMTVLNKVSSTTVENDINISTANNTTLPNEYAIVGDSVLVTLLERCVHPFIYPAC